MNLNGKNPIEILIAEDSPTQAEQLQYLLEKRGYRVTRTENGKQALASMRQKIPDLVISDIVMPEMDGYDLCQAIKDDEMLKDIPVMLVTTLSDVMDIMRGLECGADNFVRKPYAEKYLLARVEYLLMNQEMRKSQKMQMGMEIHLGGQKHYITAERQQIVDLLISVYEDAVHLNDELKAQQGQLANSNRALSALYHVAEGLNHAGSEQEVCEKALGHALELPGVRAGWVSLRDGETGFRLAAARNLPPALSAPGAMEGLCECRRRLLAGKLDHVTNILECDRLGKGGPGTEGLRYHASVPLWNGDQTLGILNLVGADQGLFQEAELDTLYGVGHQVGIALERARLHAHLEQLVKERTAKLVAEIEERKRIEQAQARLVAIIEATPDFVGNADRDGHPVYTNRAGLVMLGLDPAQGLPAKHIWEVHPEWAAQRVLEEGVPHAVAHGSWSGETALLRQDGVEIPVSQVIIAHKDADGEVELLSTIMRDITERKQAEDALRASEARLRAIIEAEPECVKIVDAEGRIVQMNAAGLAMLGADSFAQVEGKRVIDFVPQAQREAYRFFVDKVMAGQHGTFEFEITGFNGKHLWLDTHAVPLHEQGNGHTLMLAVTRDITERKQAEVALLQLNESLELRVAKRTADLERARREADGANRAKSAFLATMSHEIRTPMNGVVGMVDVLAQSKLTAHQLELVNTIRESANSLLSIIDDVLDFSKIEAGRMELERAPLSVADLVEGLCNSLIPLASRRDVALDVFVSPEIPERVLSDDMRLRQLLYNLLGNAIKFSSGRAGTPGRVEIRVVVASTSPLRLALSVADNGIGMSQETVRALFIPFTQAEVSTTRRFGGTGLGLTICKRLVDLMQGTITVESTPGKGSTFIVTLPFEVPAEQPTRAFPDLSGLDCIILEGQALRTNDLRIYLEHAGAHVRLARDAAAATRIAEQLAVPVVVILEVEQRAATLAQSPFVALPNVRHLLISRGRRRRARVDTGTVVTLDGDALRRQALLRAVAIAAGRATPENYPEKSPSLAVDEASQLTIAESRVMGRLILVVEDDEINQKVILQQLALLGYAAEIASNGVEALRLWRNGSYALILTDLHMPEMDGYTLAENVRKEEMGLRRVPILALTANALRGEANRARAAGMDEYLTKPVMLPMLRNVLEKWLPPPAAAPKKRKGKRPSSAVDVSILKSLVGDSPSAIAEVLTGYLDSVQQLAGELHTALERGDLVRVAAIVHKLKSSSRSVGAMELGDVCAGIENAAKTGDKVTVIRDMATFDAVLANVEAELGKLLSIS